MYNSMTMWSLHAYPLTDPSSTPTGRRLCQDGGQHQREEVQVMYSRRQHKQSYPILTLSVCKELRTIRCQTPRCVDTSVVQTVARGTVVVHWWSRRMVGGLWWEWCPMDWGVQGPGTQVSMLE